MIQRSSRSGDIPIAPRIAVASVIGILMFSVLLLRLWALTVLGGAEYAERADRNQLRLLNLEAPRGAILDRNGVALVTNRPARQVVVDLQDAGDEEQVDRMLQKLAKGLGVSIRDLRARVKNAPPGALEPVVLVDDLTEKTTLYWLLEQQAEFPGVQVKDRFTRQYLHGKLGAHFLGHVGPVSAEELEGAYANLEPNDRVGKSGLERQYDEFLRGANGYQAVQVDAAGVRQNSGARGLPSTPGRSLKTTVDLKVQKMAERSLAQNIARAARTFDGRDARSGAVVALHVKTGGVLALASAPSFDPEIFVNAKRWREVERLYDPKNKVTPALNRAIAGQYAPASTFKAITGLAALDMGIVEPDDLLPCPSYMEIMGQKFRNHDTRDLAPMNLATALETSCDTYFYKLALSFYSDPKSPLQSYAKRFKLGQLTGIDIPGEQPGVMPTIEWKKKHFQGWEQEWLPGDSVNMSIGQGNVETTPLQMTSVFATIANDGVMHTPHFGDSIEDAAGNETRGLSVDEPTDLKIPRAHLAAVQQGLVQVVEGPTGTARGVFEGFAVRSAGKTGTGEKFGQSDLAWYCGYAPVEKPEIAVCSFIDGGGGGSTSAAPIVRDVFEAWFNPKGTKRKDGDTQ